MEGSGSIAGAGFVQKITDSDADLEGPKTYGSGTVLLSYSI